MSLWFYGARRLEEIAKRPEMAAPRPIRHLDETPVSRTGARRA